MRTKRESYPMRYQENLADYSPQKENFQVPKPFVKWVGGKRQLLPEIEKRLPRKINTYFEPFIGGGAVMWSLDKSRLNSIVINDYNSELANLYEVVKKDVFALVEDLKMHENTSEYYYEMRKLDRSDAFQKLSPVQRASRFIYLNKTGYNGLYRVNSKGQNNVPFGRYKNPNIVDSSNLVACSAFLNDVKILNGDFESIKDMIGKDDFVYLDPPYVPLTATSNFTGYTKNGFDADMQVRLRDFCNYIDEKGANFMLSNSSAPMIYDLYKSYNIHEVMANRAVNCKASGRGKIKELLITNY